MNTGSGDNDSEFESALQAARAGAEWAIAAIYKEMNPGVIRYLRAHEPAECDDLASDVWIDVASSLARFEGNRTDLTALVFTIARRRVIDTRRKRARRKTESVPHSDLDRIESTETPEASVEHAAEVTWALETIRKLPVDQAEVILLRVIAGLDVALVATMLGKRPGTIRVLQHRALKALAKQIGLEV